MWILYITFGKYLDSYIHDHVCLEGWGIVMNTDFFTVFNSMRKCYVVKSGKYPGWVVQLIRMLFRYIKIAGSIPSRVTCMKQAMNAFMCGAANHCYFLSLSPSPSFSSFSLLSFSKTNK